LKETEARAVSLLVGHNARPCAFHLANLCLQKQQTTTRGYIVIALLLALQSFFASPRLETISYSQFNTLAKKGLLSNVVIGEKLAQLLLEKEVVERLALQSILNAKMTKEARESRHNSRSRDY
jgi:hypothetical protein